MRAKLSATNTLVNVLSNPTLVVRDGVEASIIVGNDVPTVGATASDPIQSDTQITQVLYRKTGLDLKIRPTINAEGVVVMEINQSISNTVPGASDVQGAPVFFERAVTTEVVARSGESILLAGLISERKNDTSTRVPGLGDIPGLGYLFRSDTKSKERTELVVIITPRVIEDPKEWNEIRIGMQGALKNLQLPEPTSGATGRGVGTTPVAPPVPSAMQPVSESGGRVPRMMPPGAYNLDMRRQVTLFSIDKQHKQLKLSLRTGLERAGLMLVVNNQQESKVARGGPTFANQSTIHGDQGL